MNAVPTTITQTELVPVESMRADEHPVAVYLAGFSPSSRRTMLDIVAKLGLGNEQATAWDIPWHRLRFQHIQALRSALPEKYAHTTANRILSALRGVLKAAWKLSLSRRRIIRRRLAWKAFVGRRSLPGAHFPAAN